MRHYLETIERDYPHVYGISNNKQRRRNVKVLAQCAALFEKVVACVCVCECELDATGVALSQICCP